MHDVVNSNDDGYESDPDTMSEGELRYSEDDWADADLSGVSACRRRCACNPIT